MAQVKTADKSTSPLIPVGLFLLSVGLMMIPSYLLLVEPRGQAFDLYPIWAGGRTVLSGGQPYSLETHQAIQQGVFGSVAPGDQYQHGFAHPAYITFVLLPFVLLPFSWSLLLWLSLQIPLFVAALFLGFNLLGWTPRPLLFFLLAILFTFGFRSPVNGFVVGQIVIFLIFCMLLAIWLFQQDHPEWAAVALACSAIRPDFALPAVGVALLLTKNSPKRNRFIVTCLVAGLVLLLLPAFFVGNWPVAWIQTVLTYGGNNPLVVWPPRLLSPAWVTLLLLPGMAAWTTYYVWLAWRRDDRCHQSLMISAVVCSSLVLLPQTGSYNLTFALIPAAILFRYALSVWLRTIIAASLLLPWLYFWLGEPFHILIFLLIPAQFILLQELVGLSQRKADNRYTPTLKTSSKT